MGLYSSAALAMSTRGTVSTPGRIARMSRRVLGRLARMTSQVPSGDQTASHAKSAIDGVEGERVLEELRLG
jgi:hypothetical protein